MSQPNSAVARTSPLGLTSWCLYDCANSAFPTIVTTFIFAVYNVRNDTMATIGYVTKREEGRYEGELKTLSVRASIAILPVGDKLSDNQPDFRVMSQGIEIGG